MSFETKEEISDMKREMDNMTVSCTSLSPGYLPYCQKSCLILLLQDVCSCRHCRDETCTDNWGLIENDTNPLSRYPFMRVVCERVSMCVFRKARIVKQSPFPASFFHFENLQGNLFHFQHFSNTSYLHNNLPPI